MHNTKTTKIPESMDSQNHREYHNRKTRKPRFQNQWVAKTIENTQKQQPSKISEPMGNENHREYNKQRQQKKDFRINDSGSRSLVLNYCFCLFLFGILDGFGYPIIHTLPVVWFAAHVGSSSGLARLWPIPGVVGGCSPSSVQQLPPDIQLRQMSYQLNYIRTTSLLNFWG